MRYCSFSVDFFVDISVPTFDGMSLFLFVCVLLNLLVEMNLLSLLVVTLCWMMHVLYAAVLLCVMLVKPRLSVALFHANKFVLALVHVIIIIIVIIKEISVAPFFHRRVEAQGALQ